MGHDFKYDFQTPPSGIDGRRDQEGVGGLSNV